MTALMLYRDIRARLKSAGIDGPADEAFIMMEHFCGLSRERLLTHGGGIDISPEHVSRLCAAAERRGGNYPLQYIIGHWPFMGLELSVGDGVLIPRDDTEVLVTAVADWLKKQTQPNGSLLKGADLCAGTGAAALALCALCSGIEVAAVEKFDTAYEYMSENIVAYPGLAVTAVKGDVLSPQLPGAAGLTELDFIISNPPYIAAAELPNLQPEVQREPKTALDGGSDGLLFYRGITDIWLSHLKKGGALAFEIGEGQAEAVTAMMAAKGMTEIRVFKDLQGLDRAVRAVKSKEGIVNS